jgi:hypothetical protein
MEREVSVVHYQSERNKEREGGWETCFRQQASVVSGGSCTAGVRVLTVRYYRQGTVLRPSGAAGRADSCSDLGLQPRSELLHAMHFISHSGTAGTRSGPATQRTSHAAST